jgi:hypothetical protein
MAYEIEEINFAEIGADAAALNKDNTLMDIFVRMPEKDGFVLLRFLPPQKSKPLYCSTRIHNLGTKRFHCSRVKKHLPNGIFWVNSSNNPADDCPICQEYSRLWKMSNTQTGAEQQRTQAQARQIKPIERYYWNVIVRQQVNKNGVLEKNVGPKILSCGKTLQTIVLESINGSELTGRKKLGNITHPVTGRDFRLVKKIVKGNMNSEYPKYDQSSFEDPSELGTEAEITQWINNMHGLEELRTLRPRDEMLVAMREHFNGGVSVTSEWEGVSQQNSPAQQKSAPAKAPPPPVEDTLDGEFADALKGLDIA